MANPFDQFDVATKAGNPFDQFDEPVKRGRTTGEAIKDVGAGLVSGAGALAQLPGQLYGLATGEFSDTGLTKVGRQLRETGEGMKSEELKRLEAERAAKIKEAGKEGELSAGITAFKETIANPALLSNFIAEQAPNLLPGLAVARGLSLAGAGARTAVAGAVGTGATQQGADIGAETFKELHKKLVDQGMSAEEATGRVLGYARTAGLEAGVISIAAQMLPGGRAIERAMAKTPIKGGRILGGIKGGAGEAISEAIEEGGGKVAQNLAVQKVDPTRSLTEGLGETMGMAAVGGLGLGTAAGVTGRREAPEAKPEPTAEPAAAPPAAAPPPTEAAPPVEPPPSPPSFAPPSDDAVSAMTNYWEGKPEDFGMSFSDIQNRDRSKPASIQQMTSIAAEPDYNRLSVSKDFGAGAPVVISDVEFNPQRLGRIDTVSASDGTKIPVQYAVIDAGFIVPSNRADGTTVPEYADPEFSGVRPVAGNGRVAGLQRAFQEGTANDYVSSLVNDPSHGIDPEVIRQVGQPMLVRIMPKSSLTPDIADKSNVGGQLGMSPTEQAKIDMGRFDLQGIEFLADGNASLKSLRQFVAAMPQEEQANLINRQGQPNPIAKLRLANALFAKAYANDALIDLYAEATDPEAQQILKGMSIAAPAMSNLEGAGDYDVRQYVAKAAELAVNARRQGVDLATYVDQGDIEMDPLTREVVSMFAANKNAPRRIGDSLSSLAAEAQKAYTETQGGPDLFGNAPVARPIEDVFAVLRGEPTAPAPVAVEQPEKQEYKIDKSTTEIAKEVDGMNVIEVADWLIANAPNSFAKIVAQAVRARVKSMQDRGIPMSFKVLRGGRRRKNTYGMVTGWTLPEAKFDVTINGPNVAGQEKKVEGTNYRTLLHEMLHLATQGQLTIAEKTKAKNLIGPYQDLEKLRKFILKKVKADQANNVPVPPKLNTRQALANVHELISYGMSEIEVQKYLADVDFKDKNAFTRFVDAIRRLLAINRSEQSALERLVSLSEETLEVPVEDIAKQFTSYGARYGVSTPEVSEEREPFSDVPKDEEPKRNQDFLEEKWKRMKEGAPKEKPPSFEGVSDDVWNQISPTFFPQNKNIIQKIDSMRDSFWQRMAQGIADQYRTIKDYSEEAYMKARMSKTIDGALEGILFNGQVKLTNGALDIKPNTKGLMQALEPVGNEVDRYQIWVALQRDAELVKKGKAPSVPKELVQRRDELSAGKIGNKSRLEVYEQVQRDMKKLNGSVLSIALRQGVIDKEAYKIFRRDINYIPFYKVMDEGGDVQAAATKSGLVNQYFSKALKGGERPFGDLMENTLRNWSHILSSSMKNEAANATIRAAMDVGAAFPNLKVGLRWEDGKVYSDKSGEMIGDGKLKPEYTTSGKGKIQTMIDGKPAYFEVADPLLLESIMSIGYMGPKSKFLDIARDFKNLLQFGVTLSPAFKIRNLFRDSISAIAVSDLKRNPFANVIQGWAASDRNNPAHISALAGGAIFNFGSAYEGDQSKMIRRLLDQGVKGENILDNKSKITNALRTTWTAYQDLGNKSESANRMALYQQLRDTVNPKTGENFTHLEASFYARDLLDFSMQGAWPAFRLVTQVIPFLNARVQGLYKLGRDGIVPTSRVIYNTVNGKDISATDKQKAEQFSIVMSAVALASLMLYMAFKDDEEFKKREQWDRDNFWWFKLPGMDAAVRVPKPFEIGAFGTMVERVAEQIVDQGAEGKVFEQSLKRMLTDTFAINPIPQVIKPLVDLYANKDSFTGAPIETAGMERLSKAERIAEKTSPLAIALSKVTNVFLPESTEVSPVQADYAIKGYLGWLGGTASWLSHYAVQPFSKSAYPDNNWTETMSAGFIKTLPATQSKYVTSFYENNKEISQAYADMRHFAQLGNADKVQEILKEKGDKIAMAKFYDNASKDMAKMRQAILHIRNDENMSGAQKKEEIDRLKVVIGEIARQMEESRLEVKKQYAASR